MFHLGLSYYRNLVATSFLSFWLGLEFGLQSFENEEDFDVLLLPSGDTVDGSFYADALFLTPGARIHFDVHDWVDLFVGGGGGSITWSSMSRFRDTVMISRRTPLRVDSSTPESRS